MMREYASTELGAIAAHLLGDLAATPAADRTPRIAKWIGQLDAGQQALVLAMSLEGLLGFVDALAQLTAGHRSLLDQALSRGVDSTGPIPEGFVAPNSLPEL
jgi:hypothetical protein